MRRAAPLIALIAASASADEPVTIKADLYADNWFAFYVGEELIKEDSVPITTERSFNAESFTFETTLPAQLNFIIKDFKEDDSGLEYIGTRRQQMGDGGFAGQFIDAANGELLAASGASWRCLIVHRAPLNKDCARSDNPLQDCETEITPEPDGWMLPGFDDSDWSNAIEHSAWAIQPRHGYDDIDWRDDMKLIWGEDLEIDNTLLCRATIPARD
jgi:hypothetical protein